MDKEIIFYMGIFATLSYIAYGLIMQATKTDERNSTIDFAKSEHEIASANYQMAKKNLFDSITKVHGEEKTELVAKGTIWKGMQRHLLLIAKGRANDIQESIHKDIITEKWYYGEYVNRLGNYKYTFEIILENDEIVGWRNLK